MEIILIRHGKPLSAHNEKLTADGFEQWVKDYDLSELDSASQPHQKLDLTPYYILSSDLKRAIDSTQVYCQRLPTESLPIFREMDIPYYPSNWRVRAWTWVYWNRLRWILGKPGPFESFADAKKRAQQGAELLETYADKHGKVVVFAQGMINRFIRQNLAKKGWDVVEKNDKYWGVNRLVRKI